MKRILIFSLTYYPRFVGGAEVAIKSITDRISPRDIIFDMITLRFHPDLPRFESTGNINVHRIGWTSRYNYRNGKMPWYLHINKYFYIPLALFKALSLNKKHHYDIIWSMMATYNSFSALFFKILKPKCKYVLSLQEGDPISHMKRRALPLYPIYKMIFTKADQIQVISHFLADWARNMGAKCPVCVIPNGVDYNKFHARKPQGELDKIKKELQAKDGDIFLITTSRLVKKNAIDDIVGSLVHLPNNIKLLILGQGELENSLRELTSQLGVVMRVHFLGRVSHEQILGYLQTSRIFIRPSLSEGFGNSFIEAMASGIPVIATPVGGIVDFLKDGETGLFCAVNNPMSVSDAVKKLLDDRNLVDRIVSNADQMVRNKYEWNKLALDMKNMFIGIMC